MVNQARKCSYLGAAARYAGACCLWVSLAGAAAFAQPSESGEHARDLLDRALILAFSNPQEAHELAQRGRALAEQDADTASLLRAYEMIGDYAFMVEELPEAFDAYNRALTMLPDRNVHAALYVKLQLRIGDIWRKIENFSSALAHFEEARRLANQTGMRIQYAETQCFLASYHREIKEFDHAKALLDSAFEALPKHGHEPLKSSFQLERAAILLAKGDLAGADSLKQGFLLPQKLAFGSADAARALYQAGHVDKALGRRQPAKALFLRALDSAATRHQWGMVKRVCRELTELYKQERNYESAYDAYELFLENGRYGDTPQARRAIYDLELQYDKELSRKQVRLRILATEGRVKELSNRRGQIAIYGSVAVFLLLTGLLLGVMYRVSLRRQTHRTLKRQNDHIVSKKSYLQELNEQLTASERQLRKLNHTKDQFFSIITSDLQEPLNELTDHSRAFVKSVITLEGQDLKSAALHISTYVERLRVMLEDILQWSRLQMKRIDFMPEPLKVHEMLEDSVKQLGKLYKAAPERVEIVGDAETEAFGDFKMLRYALANLIRNGLEYGAPDSVVQVHYSVNEQSPYVSVTFPLREDSQAWQDTLEHLDQYFTSGQKRPETGLAICLMVSKAFVRANEGSIELLTPDGGETARFTARLSHRPINERLQDANELLEVS